MVYYEPIRIEYSEEQLENIYNFIHKYNTDPEFKSMIDKVANNETNKTSR